MIMFLSISFLILSLYVSQIGLFIYGFLKLKPFISLKKQDFGNKRYLTVIIPFKNEENNISQLINNLKEQTLKPKYFEVSFINDNSTDKSQSIVNKLIENISNFHLIDLASKTSGKKKAIQEGIKASNTSIIVTSDADCIHQKEWLEIILNYYLKHKPKMIIAPVLMTGETLFQQQQSLEFLSLTATTAGSTGINHPIMCNGANLVYNKDIYYEFEDALNIEEVSGDDIFLMHNIKKKYSKDIHYLKSKDVIVYTEAEKSISPFFRQRIRWASKSKSYNDIDTIISAIIVFSLNVITVSLLAFSVIFKNTFLYFFIFFGIKVIVDFVILLITANYFEQKQKLYLFPIVSIIYPVYIIYTAIYSFFVKTTNWKEK